MISKNDSFWNRGSFCLNTNFNGKDVKFANCRNRIHLSWNLWNNWSIQYAISSSNWYKKHVMSALTQQLDYFFFSLFNFNSFFDNSDLMIFLSKSMSVNLFLNDTQDTVFFLHVHWFSVATSVPVSTHNLFKNHRFSIEFNITTTLLKIINITKIGRKQIQINEIKPDQIIHQIINKLDFLSKPIHVFVFYIYIFW